MYYISDVKNTTIIIIRGILIVIVTRKYKPRPNELLNAQSH